MIMGQPFYAECTACEWRVEFEGGKNGDSLPELYVSAKRRLDGHTRTNDCTDDDHHFGPITDGETA